jgi:hypothetical protein
MHLAEGLRSERQHRNVRPEALAVLGKRIKR